MEKKYIWEASKRRNELIWEAMKEGFSENQISYMFNLPVESINRVIYSMREIKGSWSK